MNFKRYFAKDDNEEKLLPDTDDLCESLEEATDELDNITSKW